MKAPIDVHPEFIGVIEGGYILNLGSGRNPIPGAVNIDLHPWTGVQVRMDMLQFPWPFRDNSFGYVTGFHVIEHFYIDKVLGPLFEIHRVLKPGGALVLEWPDFPKILKEIVDGEIGRLEALHGVESYPGATHKFAYTPEMMAGFCWAVGFKKLKILPGQDYHASQLPTIRLETNK